MTTLALTGNGAAMRLVAWGLLLFAIVGNFSISLSQVALGLTLIGTTILWRKNALKLRAAPLATPFFFLALAGLFSVFTADEHLRAFTEMKKFLVLFVFYLAYWPPMSDSFKKKVLTAFVVTASLTAILALTDVAMGKMLNDRARGFFSTSATPQMSKDELRCSSMANLRCRGIWPSTQQRNRSERIPESNRHLKPAAVFRRAVCKSHRVTDC